MSLAILVPKDNTVMRFFIFDKIYSLAKSDLLWIYIVSNIMHANFIWEYFM